MPRFAKRSSLCWERPSQVIARTQAELRRRVPHIATQKLTCNTIVCDAPRRLARGPSLRRKDGRADAALTIGPSLGGFIDAWAWFAHRLMHRPWWYKRFHKVQSAARSHYQQRLFAHRCTCCACCHAMPCHADGSRSVHRTRRTLTDRIHRRSRSAALLFVMAACPACSLNPIGAERLCCCWPALELHAYKAPSPFSALGLHPVDMVTLQVGLVDHCALHSAIAWVPWCLRL